VFGQRTPSDLGDLMHVKKLVAIVFASLLLVAAVGCGSSKKSENVNAATGGNSDQSSSSTSTTTSSSGTGSGGGQAYTSADCIQASLAYASLLGQSMGFASGATQEELDKFEQQAADLKAKIPAELKDDFETVAAAYKDYAELLKGLDMTDALNPATMQKLQQASEKLSTPEVQAAQQRIDDYFKANCGN
jgi:uncharacterized lipoprotein YehR (DUF1307 family)